MFELCWQLGVPHPDHLAAQLTPQQIAGWISWHTLEPRGSRREDIRLAMLRHDIRARETPETIESLLPTFREQTQISSDTQKLIDGLFSEAP